MKLWIDNTGLHGAGRSLDKRAESENDVKGLLQLATLILFGEGLHIGALEASSVRLRTQELSQMLRDATETSSIITIHDLNVGSYAFALEDGAERAAEHLACGVPLDSATSGSLNPELDAKDQTIEDTIVEFVRDPSPTTHYGQQELADNLAIATAHYMADSSDLLRRQLCEYTQESSKTSAEQANLIQAFLRYYANEALAEQMYCRYTPAIARANLVRSRYTFIVEQVAALVEDVASQIRGFSLQLETPSLHILLCERAKGDPDALLREVGQLREDLQPLRVWLKRLVDQYERVLALNCSFEEKSKAQGKIRREFRTLSANVRKALGFPDAARSPGSLQIVPDLLGGVITSTVPMGGAVARTLLERVSAKVSRPSRRVQVLSSLSDQAGNTCPDDRYYRLLVRNCHSRSTN